MRAPDATAIDDYLRQLGGELRGPRRLKADLLTEARGGLEDAAEAFVRDGLDAGTAQRRAVAEFGVPDELASAYQAELTAGQGRRLALLVALLPAGMLTADLMWWQPPGEAAEPPPTPFLILVETLDWTSYAAGAAALVALFLLGPASRRRWIDPRRIVRPLALLALATCLFIWALGTFAAVGTVTETPGVLTWPPMLAAWLMLNTLFWLLTRMALRVVAVTRFRPAAA